MAWQVQSRAGGSFRNPAIANGSLWAAFVYWFYRYYVYFHDLGDKGFAAKRRKCVDFLVLQWALKKFDTDSAWRDQRIESVLKLLKTSTATSNELDTQLKSDHQWTISGEPGTGCVGVPTGQNIGVQVLLALSVRRPSGKWEVAQKKHDPVAIVGLEAMTLNIRAAGYVLIHTRLVSEYALPFLIALLPVGYWGIHRLLGGSVEG